MLRLPFLLPALLCLGACATMPVQPSAPVAQAQQRAPVTILISIDGFRADYLQRGVTPQLAALGANGVEAPMCPSFPTKTFPNHWAIVTGDRPDRNVVQHPIYDVWVRSCAMEWPESGPDTVKLGAKGEPVSVRPAAVTLISS